MTDEQSALATPSGLYHRAAQKKKFGTMTGLGISANLNRDAQTFTLTKDEWWNSYPVEDLAAWLAFYRRMLKQTGRENYRAIIAALEGVRDQLRDHGTPPAL